MEEVYTIDAVTGQRLFQPKLPASPKSNRITDHSRSTRPRDTQSEGGDDDNHNHNHSKSDENNRGRKRVRRDMYMVLQQKDQARKAKLQSMKLSHDRQVEQQLAAMKTSSLPQSDLIVKEANDRHVRDLFKVMLVLQGMTNSSNSVKQGERESLVDDQMDKSEIGMEISDNRAAALGLDKITSTDVERMMCLLDESKVMERHHLHTFFHASNQSLTGGILTGGGVDNGPGLGLGLGQDSTSSSTPGLPSSSSLAASLISSKSNWSTLTIDLTTDLSVFEKHTRSLLQTAREERLHQLAVAFANNEQQQQQQQQQQQSQPGPGNMSTGEHGMGEQKHVLSSWDAFDVSQLRRSPSGALVYTGALVVDFKLFMELMALSLDRKHGRPGRSYLFLTKKKKGMDSKSTEELAHAGCTFRPMIDKVYHIRSHNTFLLYLLSSPLSFIIIDTVLFNFFTIDGLTD